MMGIEAFEGMVRMPGITVNTGVVEELVGLGGFLQCSSCGRRLSISDADVGGSLTSGWPKCCGATMHWWTRRQLTDILAEARTVIRGALADAQEKAPPPPERGPGDWETICLRGLLSGANTWAAVHGFPRLTLDDVIEVEQRSVGHSDYGSKAALYVAERMLGLSDG